MCNFSTEGHPKSKQSAVPSATSCPFHTTEAGGRGGREVPEDPGGRGHSPQIKEEAPVLSATCL